jgi:hypothetical protein
VKQVREHVHDTSAALGTYHGHEGWRPCPVRWCGAAKGRIPSFDQSNITQPPTNQAHAFSSTRIVRCVCACLSCLAGRPPEPIFLTSQQLPTCRAHGASAAPASRRSVASSLRDSIAQVSPSRMLVDAATDGAGYVAMEQIMFHFKRSFTLPGPKVVAPIVGEFVRSIDSLTTLSCSLFLNLATTFTPSHMSHPVAGGIA